MTGKYLAKSTKITFGEIKFGDSKVALNLQLVWQSSQKIANRQIFCLKGTLKLDYPRITDNLRLMTGTAAKPLFIFGRCGEKWITVGCSAFQPGVTW